MMLRHVPLRNEMHTVCAPEWAKHILQVNAPSRSWSVSKSDHEVVPCRCWYVWLTYCTLHQVYRYNALVAMSNGHVECWSRNTLISCACCAELRLIPRPALPFSFWSLSWSCGRPHIHVISNPYVSHCANLYNIRRAFLFRLLTLLSPMNQCICICRSILCHINKCYDFGFANTKLNAAVQKR